MSRRDEDEHEGQGCQNTVGFTPHICKGNHDEPWGLVLLSLAIASHHGRTGGNVRYHPISSISLPRKQLPSQQAQRENFRWRQEPAVFPYSELQRNDFWASFVTKCQFRMDKGKRNPSNGVLSHVQFHWANQRHGPAISGAGTTLSATEQTQDSRPSHPTPGLPLSW